MHDNRKDNSANATANPPRKGRRFGWIFEEWVFQIALVLAVVTAMVDGVLRIGTSTLV
jgi:hypothetical protein